MGRRTFFDPSVGYASLISTDLAYAPSVIARRAGSAMEANSAEKFAHRPIRDSANQLTGEVDSICLECFQTVATTTNAGDRELQGEGHRCRGIKPDDLLNPDIPRRKTKS